jgi:quercetin dioxygenase-like cupin family protein
MPLLHLHQLPVRELFPGLRARLVHSDRVTHSWVDVDAGATFPEHQHPHEQIVNVLKANSRSSLMARPTASRRAWSTSSRPT